MPPRAPKILNNNNVISKESKVKLGYIPGNSLRKRLRSEEAPIQNDEKKKSETVSLKMRKSRVRIKRHKLNDAVKDAVKDVDSQIVEANNAVKDSGNIKLCRVRLQKLTLESIKKSHAKISTNLNNVAVPQSELNDARKIFKTKSPAALSPSTNTKNLSKDDAKDDSNIYDFLSQSSCNSDVDRSNQQIIEKMVREGKAVIAHRKVKGRNPKTKAKPKAKKNERNTWKNVVKNLNIDRAKKIIPLKDHSAKIGKVVEISEDVSVNFFDDGHVSPQRVEKSPSKELNRKSPSVAPDKTKLLEYAKSIFVQSTPVQKTKLAQQQSPKPDSASPKPSSASPKLGNASPKPGNASPWRVQEKVLPKVFYFSRNSDDLPSFSSDYFPASQSVQHTSPPESSATSTPNPRTRRFGLSLNPAKNQEINSRDTSLNDSNMENISPIMKPSTSKSNVLQNAPPRSIRRNPLQQIQILQNIRLPNIRTLLKDNKYITQHLEKPVEENPDNSAATLGDSANFFGFEDLCSETENELVPVKSIPNKADHKKKLKALKRLLPAKPTRISFRTVKEAFDKPKKQADIRNLLSSTVVSNKTQNSPDFDESADMSLVPEESDDVSVHLFNDPDALQTSFDTRAPIKTYSRKPNRFRHNFVMYPTDSSDEEEVVRKKRTKRTKRENKELREFVTEFNSMCEEVDQYELVTEPSRSKENE